MEPNEYMPEIGKRLKKAREATGMSLQDVEKALDSKLSASRIGNYEQGTRLPGPYEISVLANLYGVSAAYLMCLDNQHVESARPPVRKLLTELERNLIILVKNAFETAQRAMGNGTTPKSFVISPDSIKRARIGRGSSSKARRQEKKQPGRKGATGSTS